MGKKTKSKIVRRKHEEAPRLWNQSQIENRVRAIDHEPPRSVEDGDDREPLRLKSIQEVSRAWGISRQTIWRWKQYRKHGGRAALQDRSRSQPRLDRRLDPKVEAAILGIAAEHPAWSARVAVKELRAQGFVLSTSGVRCVWVRHRLQRKAQREGMSRRRRTEGDGLECVHGVLSIGAIGDIGDEDDVIVQHSFIDLQSGMAWVRLYPVRKPRDPRNPLLYRRRPPGSRPPRAGRRPRAREDLRPRGVRFLKDDVLPFFDEHGATMAEVHASRSGEIMSTRQGREGLGATTTYEECLAERCIRLQPMRSGSRAATILREFYQAELNEFLRPTIRRWRYLSLEDLQADLDEWLRARNNDRGRRDPICLGRTALSTFLANCSR